MVLFIKLDQLLTVFFWFLGPLLLFTAPASLLLLLLRLLRYMEKNKANDVNLWRRLMNDHHLFGQSHSFCSRIKRIKGHHRQQQMQECQG